MTMAIGGSALGEPASLLQVLEEVAEEEGAGLVRGLLDDVASGGERGFAVDALDGVGGRVELALEEALLDVLLGEVFVADDLAFAGELLGVGDGLVVPPMTTTSQVSAKAVSPHTRATAQTDFESMHSFSFMIVRVIRSQVRSRQPACPWSDAEFGLVPHRPYQRERKEMFVAGAQNAGRLKGRSRNPDVIRGNGSPDCVDVPENLCVERPGCSCHIKD